MMTTFLAKSVQEIDRPHVDSHRLSPVGLADSSG
jgi:hypothetical protein